VYIAISISIIYCAHDKCCEYAKYYFVVYIVAAQLGPGRVIVHPGQDVELLCNITGGTAWRVNGRGPYGISALRNGIISGHSSYGRNIIVKNVMLNDIRNGTWYKCVVTQGDLILNESSATHLFIAGEFICII